jgi:hypothetical protein
MPRFRTQTAPIRHSDPQEPIHEEIAMLTPLNILSLDQGKLRRPATSEEDYFARYAPAPAPAADRPRWYALGLAWPLFGKRAEPAER